MLLPALVVMAMAIAGMAGCGGGDDTPATTAGAGDGTQERAAAGGAGGGAKADGGGDGGGATGTGPKAQFIREADAVCRKAQARTAREYGEYAAGEKGSGEQGRVNQEIAAKVIVPRLEERIEGIEALDPPSEAEQAAETVIAGFEELRDAAEADPDAFDGAAAAMLPEIQKAASREGFDDCAGYLG